MLLVIFAVSIILVAIGMIIYTRFSEGTGIGLTLIGGVLTFVSVVALCTLLARYSESRIIDDKIKLYENQNNEINESVIATVESYKEYEKETFEELKIKDAAVLINAYPELKTDTLVQEQIKIYIQNKKKILKLKEEKLEYKVYAWWLYFGG